MSAYKSTECDVAVIGAGPGGYVAAIRCAQLGLKTVCVDEWQNHQGQPVLGGACLNVGCIPSKALLESSQLYHRAKLDFASHGISASGLQMDVSSMQARKKQIVHELTMGINGLFKANNVQLIHGRAKITAIDTVAVSDRETHKKTHKITAKHIIIATGSSPIRLEQAKLDADYIVDSAGALELESVPPRLGIVGAGAIGLELGSVWSRLGSEVVLLDAMQDFLPLADSRLASLARRSLGKQSLDIRLGARVIKAEVKNKKVELLYEDDKGEHKETFDRLVVAVGRKPNSDRLFGDELGIERDERHSIIVNKNCQTSVPHIYAIGDVVRGPMLAHKASAEAILVAEQIAGNYAEVDYELIPSVIYTHPEIAWVGKTEEACNSAGIEIKTGSFPLAASGRARAMNETEGLVKIIADASSDRILGVHIFAAQASELIAQAVAMLEMQATVEDLVLQIVAHPTLSEALHEAALSVHGRSIHVKNQAGR